MIVWWLIVVNGRRKDVALTPSDMGQRQKNNALGWNIKNRKLHIPLYCFSLFRYVKENITFSSFRFQSYLT